MWWNGRKEQSSLDLGESRLRISLKSRLRISVSLVEARLDRGESGHRCDHKTILPVSFHLPAASPNRQQQVQTCFKTKFHLSETFNDLIFEQPGDGREGVWSC